MPIGEPAFRTNLLSAALGAGACGVAAHLARRWSGGSALAGIVAAGILATGRTYWSVSTVTEVYTAHVLLVLSMLLAADRVREASDRAVLRRGAWVLAILSGLALAHHPTVVLVLPAAAVLCWRVRPRGKKARPGPSLGAGTGLGAASVAIGIAALAYGSLLLRARLAPEATWNHFTSVPEWWTHVTASAYRPFDLGWGALLRLDRWRLVSLTLSRDLGPAGVALSIAGALASMAIPRVRAALGLLVVLHVSFGLRYGTEDVEVNLLVAVVALALLAGIGAARAVSRLPRRALAPAGAVLFLAAVAPGAWRFRAMDLHEVTLAADYGRDVLASVPSGGTLVADGDNAFVLAYLTRVLGERPDLSVYDRGGHLLGDLVPASRGAMRERAEFAAEQALMERVRIAKIALAFLSWPGYDPAPGLRFRPRGLVYALEREGTAPSSEPSLHGERVTAQAARSGDLLARTLAASYPVMAGERALFEGDAEAAERAFGQARAVAGDSETVRNTLGTIYGRRGELLRAKAEFEAALRAKPASPRAAANLEMVRRLLR